MDGPTSFVTLASITGPWSNSQWYGSVEEARANGRLIAAAPELLAALEECAVRLREWVELDDEDDLAACGRAFAAIGKAKGLRP
jgi:hypothetical protein